MKNNNNSFRDSHLHHIQTVDGITFTQRELDVISLIFHGRGDKRIASLLSIAPKTVHTHVRNITAKLKCNSREGIIDFIEKSGSYPFIKNYYLNLLIKTTFEKQLQNIFLLLAENGPTCTIEFWHKDEGKKPLIYQLEEHLKITGIKASVVIDEISNLFNFESTTADYVLYFLSENLIKQLNSQEGKLGIFQLIQRRVESSRKAIFLLENKRAITNLPNEISRSDCLILEEEKYYFSFFELLKRLLPSIDIDKHVLELKKQYENIHTSSQEITSQRSSETDLRLHNEKRREKFAWFIQYWKVWLFMSCIFSLGMFGIVVLRENKESIQSQNWKNSLRSDLPLPTDEVLLNRPELLSKIEHKLQNPQGIQIAALVGIGGAGKTTLAHQYARSQENSLVWEINAETKDSLISSLEALAYATSKKEEEKKELRAIEDIKNVAEKAQQLIFFLKERLKAFPNWLLIYDNVENFHDIIKYFPHDAKAWGTGKIIITTRNANIKNSSYVGEANIIYVGELNDKEKLSLFKKILGPENVHNPKLFQTKEKSGQILQEIPSFPLDISIAAYYLKNAHISYSQYLHSLYTQGTSFATIQENVLKDVGEYTKTRYGIVTLSLKNLLETNKEYEGLLLLISLLDSQNIPKDLLCFYKNDSIINNFIHDLKKHSLIMERSFNDGTTPMFSIHRTTQQIILSQLVKLLNLEKDNQLFHSLAATLGGYLAKVTDSGDFPKMKILANHSMAFLSHDSLLDNKIKGYVESELGRLYYYFDHYKRAEQLLEGSLDKLKKGYKENHNKIAQTLVYLGIVSRELGDYKKAKELLEVGLATYNHHHSENHLGAAWALAHLGNVYREFEEYKKAEEILKKSISLYKKQLGGNHAELCWALVYLGDVYRSLGNYSQAKECYKESLLVNKKLYGQSHLRTARAMVYLANSHEYLGEYNEAKSLLEQSLSIYKNHFSEEHVRVAWVLVYLGSIYKRLGDYPRAENALYKSLEIHKKYYGEEHIKTAWNLVYLGDVYETIGHHNKAKALLEKSLDIHKKHYGANHPKTAWISMYLGNVYRNLGNYGKAEDFFKKSLIIYTKHYGKDHIETAQILRNMGLSYLLEGRVETAEVLLKKALNIFQQHKHPETYIAFENLSQLYLSKFRQAMSCKNFQQAQNYKQGAIACLEKALKIVQVYFQKESPHYKRIGSKLTHLN
jgi:tetratricopeptide (TPR) repeat protein/DNA-binding CsgD family transcriptional regulator